MTHRTVPTLKLGDALRAAFDPHDDPNHPPKQSSSEQQAKVVVPINGLQMWDDILRQVAMGPSFADVNLDCSGILGESRRMVSVLR